MSPKLYMVAPSPPVRAVQMVAKHIGLNLELVEVDMFNTKEHLQPEYLKLNPTHTVPTLVDDDGFVLWESHAILAYLVKKYGKNDALYPKDLKKRTIINQKLHFENGVAFGRLFNITRAFSRGTKKSLDQADIDSLNEMYGFVEAFLANDNWIAGDSPTIADYSLIASISSADNMVPIDCEKYPKLVAWWKRCEELDGYEANKKGLEMLKEMTKGFFR